MEDLRKRLLKAEERISYLGWIKEGSEWANLPALQEKLQSLRDAFYEHSHEHLAEKIGALEESLTFLESRCEETLSPMERVRIVRSPLRFSLKDILENVYEEYTELGGEEDANIDPALVAARASIARRVKNKVVMQQVMVIGHEKGHGEEYRNGGSTKPWGNEKALRYMRVAETEGIPIHFYVFTPGAFPVEEYPGAGQQIARNLYAMAKLRVPMVAVTSEGGSGGAEAVGMGDFRLMFSHGYYSVISPEGAAAIEGKIREGVKVPKDLLENCAERLAITAEDNLRHGTIDRIIQEPLLGARRDDFTFFRRVKDEMIRATDEVVLKTKSLRAFRAYELKMEKAGPDDDLRVYVSWELADDEIGRLLQHRSRKYRQMATKAYREHLTTGAALYRRVGRGLAKFYYTIRYDVLKSRHKQVKKVMQDVSGEGSVLIKQMSAPFTAAYDFITRKPGSRATRGSAGWGTSSPEQIEYGEIYTSSLANEDRTVSCPNAERHGCKDLWVPDLYGEFCGVCENCGHHFPLEYQWYMKHLFEPDSIREFNADLASINPLSFPGFDKKLEAARKKTGRPCAMITFDARVMGIDIVVAMLYSDFRNGTVGAAEGEKFARACEIARIKRRPLLSYVHTTGGIRIHEGTMGVIQMPKCTMAVREYIDSGGLYIVVYDNNSYAGPVASFLGCSPYQFAIRSSRLGFAGPRVIRDTTGEDVPPDYHGARSALKRGHIQGIWDRRDFRRNLHKSLMTMGGGNLYYR
ncbi:acetyl-CoA carboxylase carboxyl transferase subunit alpha/beta [Desulfurivibrio alkaliphilus]|uniref:Acetyl-coenzyme A carboxylase carboxyl transferase subunits beta/alpha n=1 Tax=Desulfurivibrio alkaliphilus (strain DSM 19089 / UNIQEM U267 / AHT2) TaxID=589865 RepID=D6Z010_DESAT|nr:acetyl-CoA carboxylase carboxyl transferase subunit alpha/beta [Desulfurivibrio alkaliphilus]ADH85167.1 Acetyl-CoA carboxylase [Desulfurivibrio alkaliphilus AHT 2]